jgi:hypothetical protein
MAQCVVCLQEMTRATDCRAYRQIEFPDGTRLTSIPNSDSECGDCGGGPRWLSPSGLRLGALPSYARQLISCDCEGRVPVGTAAVQ